MEQEYCTKCGDKLITRYIKSSFNGNKYSKNYGGRYFKIEKYCSKKRFFNNHTVIGESIGLSVPYEYETRYSLNDSSTFNKLRDEVIYSTLSEDDLL